MFDAIEANRQALIDTLKGVGFCNKQIRKFGKRLEKLAQKVLERRDEMRKIQEKIDFYRSIKNKKTVTSKSLKILSGQCVLLINF